MQLMYALRPMHQEGGLEADFWVEIRVELLIAGTVAILKAI